MSMQIVRELAPTSTLDAFAEENGLVMVVTERRMDRWQRANRLPQFTACFRGVEVRAGGLLLGAYGEGESEHDAILDYARRIANETIVVDAMKPTRREIRAPRFYELSS